MSLQYVIDGYNIIHSPQFSRKDKKLKDCRQALIDFILIHKLCGSPKNSVTVVFDGYPKDSLSPQTSSAFQIIFTREETADEKIKKIIETAKNPKNIVVVSDDKEIKFFAKLSRAKYLSIEEFIGEKVKAQSTKIKETLKPELTYTQMHEINEELRKLWLK